jgi:hypothetical protein
MWAIKAVFTNGTDEAYTFYDEELYPSESEALSAINGIRGELLAQASTIDSQSEDDLQGYYFDDLVPYEVKE